MTQKDFWRNSKVTVIGAGSWGSCLAAMAARNCQQVRLWTRSEEHARQMNATRANAKYVPELVFNERVQATSDIEKALGHGEGGVHAVVWALPSGVVRENARRMAGLLRGDEIIFHAIKGIEEGTMKRVSEILREELPCPRIGVLSGPNLAHEIGRGEPGATVIASAFEEVIDAGHALFTTDRFRIYSTDDVIGVEWAGTLKNILAIASGTLDAMKFGWNTRSMLITRGLAEMVRFGVAMGARESTFLGLAGIGDLMATCSSSLSRNYRVGIRLAEGQKLAQILSELGSTAEGVRTARHVYEFARTHRIEMPITEGVYHLIEGEAPVQEILHSLMTRTSAD
jgi:glycerol-3-phosphate dehydrogenase (NAD(P)+)